MILCYSKQGGYDKAYEVEEDCVHDDQKKMSISHVVDSLIRVQVEVDSY